MEGGLLLPPRLASARRQRGLSGGGPGATPGGGGRRWVWSVSAPTSSPGPGGFQVSLGGWCFSAGPAASAQLDSRIYRYTCVWVVFTVKRVFTRSLTLVFWKKEAENATYVHLQDSQYPQMPSKPGAGDGFMFNSYLNNFWGRIPVRGAVGVCCSAEVVFPKLCRNKAQAVEQGPSRWCLEEGVRLEQSHPTSKLLEHGAAGDTSSSMKSGDATRRTGSITWARMMCSCYPTQHKNCPAVCPLVSGHQNWFAHWELVNWVGGTGKSHLSGKAAE